jgi:hypothetical protein
MASLLSAEIFFLLLLFVPHRLAQQFINTYCTLQLIKIDDNYDGHGTGRLKHLKFPFFSSYITKKKNFFFAINFKIAMS